MAVSKEKTADAAPIMSIDEFCSRTSESDKRVELVSAFFNNERSSGRVNDTFVSYAARYKSFINQPA
jgi:hypothetical protein